MEIMIHPRVKKFISESGEKKNYKTSKKFSFQPLLF
jgi:hypothetical protein